MPRKSSHFFYTRRRLLCDLTIGAGTLTGEQAAGSILNPTEMGSSWTAIIPALAADPACVKAFGHS